MIDVGRKETQDHGDGDSFVWREHTARLLLVVLKTESNG
jgi:hypothetical protein